MAKNVKKNNVDNKKKSPPSKSKPISKESDRPKEEEHNRPENKEVNRRRDFLYLALKKLGPGLSIADLEHFIKTDEQYKVYHEEFRKMDRYKISKRIYKFKVDSTKTTMRKSKSSNATSTVSIEESHSIIPTMDGNEDEEVKDEISDDHKQEQFKKSQIVADNQSSKQEEVLSNEAEYEENLDEPMANLAGNDLFQSLMKNIETLQNTLDVTNQQNQDLFALTQKSQRQIKKCSRVFQQANQAQNEPKVQPPSCNHDSEIMALQLERENLLEEIKELKKKLKAPEPIQHTQINDTIKIPADKQRSNKGLTAEQFDEFVKNTKSIWEEERCSICFGNYQNGQEIVSMYCSKDHFFHLKCIEMHFYDSKKCPTCKKDQVELKRASDKEKDPDNIEDESAEQVADPSVDPAILKMSLDEYLQERNNVKQVNRPYQPGNEDSLQEDEEEQAPVPQSLLMKKRERIQESVESSEMNSSISLPSQVEEVKIPLFKVEFDPKEEANNHQIAPMQEIQLSDDDAQLPDKEQLHPHEIYRLNTGQFLNDGIIDAYAKLLQTRIDQHSDPQIHLFTAMNMQALVGDCKFKNFVQKIVQKNPQIILSPMNIDKQHWALLCVDMQSKVMYIIDSQGSALSLDDHKELYKHCLSAMEKFLQAFMTEKIIKRELMSGNFNTVVPRLRQIATDEATEVCRTFKIDHLQDVPQQPNGIDCGLYVCMFMEIISRTGSYKNLSIDLNNATLTEMRKILLEEITLWAFKSRIHKGLLKYSGVVLDKNVPQNKGSETESEEFRENEDVNMHSDDKEEEKKELHTEHESNEKSDISEEEDSPSEHEYQPIPQKKVSGIQLLLDAAKKTKLNEQAAMNAKKITAQEYLEQDLKKQAEMHRKEKMKERRARQKMNKKAAKKNNIIEKTHTKITVKEAIEQMRGKKQFKKK